MNLKNKIVLITGSSSGIGKTTAVRFAKEGAKIVINYIVNREGAEETQNEIKKLGGESIIVQADVSKPEDIKRMFDETVKEFKTVDISQLVNTDLIAPMICSQYAIKLMQEQGYGKVLNTSSIRGAEHGGRSVVYAASKAGLNSFTKTLAKKVAPQIQVNAVAPGFVKTRNYDKMAPEQLQSFLDQTYLKRWVTEDEIADAFVFLAKNDAMTGQVIYVDAGFTLK